MPLLPFSFPERSGRSCPKLIFMLEKSGCSCWLGMEAKNLTLEGMRQGVVNAECFVLVLTSGVLFRPYCIDEIFMAVSLHKPAVLIVEQDPKYSPWSYDELRRECAGGAGSDYQWCRAELAKVEQRGDAAAQRMLDAVAGLIEAHRQMLIPYRRRNFESSAMIYEIVRRKNLYGVGSLASPTGLSNVRWQPSAALGVALPMDRSCHTSAVVDTTDNVYLSIVSSGTVGGSVEAQLQGSLRDRGVSVGTGAAAAQSSRILFVLTNGALLDPDFMSQLHRSIKGNGITRQRSKEQISVCASHEAVAGLFRHQEFITHREPGRQALEYEHDAIVEDIIRRFRNRDQARCLLRADSTR